jgi:acylphosphatase
VQGVGFRATAAAVAERFEVTGWVRNEPDGSVVLEVQGDDAEVAAYRAALRGRLGRNIHGEADSPIGEVDGEAGFEVRR